MADRNTRYYHTKTIIRRRKSKILMLRNDAGDLVSDQNELIDLATSHFKNLFTEDNDSRPFITTSMTFPTISYDIAANMSILCNDAEIYIAIDNIGPFKAPGDGFSAIFFQKKWKTVGTSVIHYIKMTWANHEHIEGINNTLISLIPKIDCPEFINQFRPIALCNVIYKCITVFIFLSKRKGIQRHHWYTRHPNYFGSPSKTNHMQHNQYN